MRRPRSRFLLIFLAMALLLGLLGISLYNRLYETAGAPATVSPANDVETATLPSMATKPYEVIVTRDIPYATGDQAHARRLLDVYVPAGPVDFPVLMFVSGGNWTAGSKDWVANIGQALAERGIGVVLVNHRLEPEVQFPGQIEDLAHAFAWISANIAGFGGDPARIQVGGHSAGGHLTSLLVMDGQYLNAVGHDEGDVAGLVLVSAVLESGDRFDNDQAASPIYHVRAGLPPTLLLVASQDFEEMQSNAQAMQLALVGASVFAKNVVVPERDHLTITRQIGTPNDPTTQLIYDWLTASYDGSPDGPQGNGGYAVEMLRSIPYVSGVGADPRHVLDIYAPKGIADYPVLMFVASYSLTPGSKNWSANIGISFATKGIGVVLVDHRLEPEAPYPAQVDDLALAFRWIKENIASYGGEPSQIVVGGHSDGGQLAGLLAMDDQYLARLGHEVHELAGVLFVSGVVDASEWFPEYPAASPLHHLRAGLPPVMLLVADGDFPIILSGAQAMQAGLEKIGVATEHVIVPASNHFTITAHIGRPGDLATASISNWIRNLAEARFDETR